MNYLLQINSFLSNLVVNPLSSNAQTVYFHLLNINNKCHWIPTFTVANKTIESLSGLSRVQVHRARNELKQKGYIDYEKGTGNMAGKYLIVIFDTQKYTQGYTQTCTQDDTQMLQDLNTLNKQKTNKTKQNFITGSGSEEAVSYIQIMDLYNTICLSYPKIKGISGYRKKMVAERFMESGNTDDFKELFVKAEQSSFLKGENKRNWHADFDWIINPTNMNKVLEGRYDKVNDTNKDNKDYDKKNVGEAKDDKSVCEDYIPGGFKL